MKEKEEYDEDIIKTKIHFFNEKLDIQLNSDFNSFVKNICNILKIPREQYNSLIISYNDEDNDNIILSTEEDYILYWKQLKDKVVNELIVEIKEDSKINPLACFSSALNYQDQIDEVNNQIKNENNNIMKNNNNFINKDIINNKYSHDNLINNSNIENNNDNFDNFNLNNNNNLINNKIINNNNNINDIMKNNNINNDNTNYNFDNFNQNNNNLIDNKDPYSDNAPIDDIVFDYKCSSCSTYPIIFVLYYCPKCQIHLCEECIKKNENHKHPFEKFVSRKELMKLKEKENCEIDKMNKIKEKQINNQNNENNNIPNLINNNIENNEFNLFEMIKSIPNPLQLLKDERIKYIIKKNRKTINNFREKVSYGPSILKARYQYNLDGIDNKKLFEALKQTNGNIEEALILLTK